MQVEFVDFQTTLPIKTLGWQQQQQQQQEHQIRREKKQAIANILLKPGDNEQMKENFCLLLLYVRAVVFYHRSMQKMYNLMKRNCVQATNWQGKKKAQPTDERSKKEFIETAQRAKLRERTKENENTK